MDVDGESTGQACQTSDFGMHPSAEEGKWDSLDKVLARSGPLEGEDFPASEEAV